MTNRIINVYDTTDNTDPSNPIAKKGIVYAGKTTNHIIFVLPEELDAKIAELTT